MKTLVNLNFLRIPMSLLYDIDKCEDFVGLSAVQTGRLAEEYTAEELSGILQALAYAYQHPSHDFKSMMPGLPQSNAEIAGFLKRVYLSIPRRDER